MARNLLLHPELWEQESQWNSERKQWNLNQEIGEGTYSNDYLYLKSDVSMMPGDYVAGIFYVGETSTPEIVDKGNGELRFGSSGISVKAYEDAPSKFSIPVENIIGSEFFISFTGTTYQYSYDGYSTGGGIGWIVPADEEVCQPVNFNCQCDDPNPSRTLAELRQVMFSRLGMPDPITDAEHRTLASLRRDLLVRLGFAAQVSDPPPGMTELLNQFITEAEQVLWRRLELGNGGQPLPARMADDADESTLDAPLVFALALASAKGHYGQPDAELYLKKAEQMLTDYAKRSPPGIRKQVDSFLRESQAFLYRAYPVLRTERFFTWQMEAGQRLYDVDGNNDDCPRKLDPRMLSWVGVSEGDNNWRSLTCGIPPESYQRAGQRGTPYRYEIRQCIEVWPAPDDRPWRLRVKGDFGLLPLVEDDDRCTIDDEAVLLHALSRAKAHFEQRDAENYERDALAHIKNLTAGAHHTRRYVPGTRVAVPDGWPGFMREGL